MSAMNTTPRVALVAVLICFVAMASQAIEPTYTGKYGNPEEPALRVYKCMWRGLKTIPYHTVRCAKAGHEKVPYYGYVQASRGARFGMVELGRSTYRGMAGSLPRPVTEVGTVNRYIEDHPTVRAVADTVPAYLGARMLGAPPVKIDGSGWWPLNPDTWWTLDAPPWNAMLFAIPIGLAQVKVDEIYEREQAAKLAQAGRKPIPQTVPTDGIRDGSAPPLQHLLFGVDKSALTPDAIVIADKAAAYLQANPGKNVIIEGHACDLGTDDYNMALSQRRADAVKRYLVEQGIAADRVKTEAYGTDAPASFEPKKRRLNRRAVVIVCRSK